MATREGTRASIEFMCIYIVPDVCKSPVIPVPYKILSKFDCAVAFSTNVRFRQQKAFRHNSRLSTVLCNEQGVGGGVLSGVNRGFCRPIDGTSSTTVRVNGSFVDYHEGTYMFMNCAGPEGPFNTIGRVCFLGNMLPGPVPKSGKIPKSCFSCISDLVSQLEDAVGPIDELVEKGKLLYSLAQTDWSDPSSVLGAIGGVAGIAGLQDVAGLAQDAKDLYDTGKKVMNTDWSDPKQALAAVAGISNVLGMEDIAQVAGMADKIRDTINTDWSDPKAAIKAAKNIMSATGLDDMADEFIRDLLTPSAGDDANADLPDCFPRPGKSIAASTATPPVCDPAKIPVSKDGKPRQCITQDVANEMKLTNPLAHERYQMMSPAEQANAFVETNSPSVDGNGNPVPAKDRKAVYLPGQGFSTTADERQNSILPDTPSWLKEVFVAEKDGDKANFLGIKEKKGNWYLFGGLVDLGSPEMPGAGAADTWFIPDNFFGLDMSSYYDYHDKNYYGSNVKLSNMDSILSHELKAMVAGIVENPLTVPLQAIYSTATTLVGTVTAAKNSVVGAFDDLSNMKLPGREMFDSLSDMYGKLFGETSAATPADVLDPTAGGGCFGGGAASSAGAGGTGGAPGNPAPPGTPAKPPGTAPSGSPASGAGSDGILVTTKQGNPAAAAAAIEANFRAANAKALADAQAKEKADKEKADKEKADKEKADKEVPDSTSEADLAKDDGKPKEAEGPTTNERGGKHHDQKDVDAILKDIRDGNLAKSFGEHFGQGKYDFKHKAPNDTFDVFGKQMTAAEFGNFTAGYAGLYHGGAVGELGVRLGGVGYDAADALVYHGLKAVGVDVPLPPGSDPPYFDFDKDSWPAINAGVDQARKDKFPNPEFPPGFMRHPVFPNMIVGPMGEAMTEEEFRRKYNA